MENIEKITGVALYINETGSIWALPKPARHNNLFALAAFLNQQAEPATQGFMTSEGRFVNRADAMIIAAKSLQLIKNIDSKYLYSEDLW